MILIETVKEFPIDRARFLMLNEGEILYAEQNYWDPNDGSITEVATEVPVLAIWLRYSSFGKISPSALIPERDVPVQNDDRPSKVWMLGTFSSLSNIIRNASCCPPTDGPIIIETDEPDTTLLPLEDGLFIDSIVYKGTNNLSLICQLGDKTPIEWFTEDGNVLIFKQYNDTAATLSISGYSGIESFIIYIWPK